MPAWLYAWLFFMMATYLASLLFVRQHAAARWVFAGVVASHAMVAAIEFGELAVLRKGLVSLTHVLGWTPALVVMLRELARVPGDTRYGIWCRVLVPVMAIALVFDYRDAGMYLYYWWSDHPAFL